MKLHSKITGMSNRPPFKTLVDSRTINHINNAVRFPVRRIVYVQVVCQVRKR